MNRLLEKYPFLSNRWFLLVVYVLIVIGVYIQRMSFGPASYNNYSIFHWSFHNLQYGDLYAMHPGQHQDLFKYSPTFAFLMGPFHAMPTWLGLLTWIAINTLAPFWAVQRLEIRSEAKAFILLFAAIELVSSLQNSQSNGLMTGLIIGAFAAFERGKPVWAALFICLGFYVKLFAAVAAVLFIFYEKKGQFIAMCLFWGLLLGLLPAALIGTKGLVDQYSSWLHLLEHDPAHELNYSIMTLTQRWFHFTAPDTIYLVLGIILLLLPLIKYNRWSSLHFRLGFLASVLIWVVIFNHKAESPTFVIAMFGAAVWGITQPTSWQRSLLLIFVFVLTGLSATDLFPPYVREHFIRPYCLKALPCIVLWLYITWNLLLQHVSKISGKTLVR